MTRNTIAELECSPRTGGGKGSGKSPILSLSGVTRDSNAGYGEGMSYKLTLNIDNATLGEFAAFVQAAQDLGAPDSAVLDFDGSEVSVEIDPRKQPAEVVDPQSPQATPEEVFQRVQQEPIVQDLLDTVREFSSHMRNTLRDSQQNPQNRQRPQS